MCLIITCGGELGERVIGADDDVVDVAVVVVVVVVVAGVELPEVDGLVAACRFGAIVLYSVVFLLQCDCIRGLTFDVQCLRYAGRLER